MALREPPPRVPDPSFERGLLARGVRSIAGVDEAGRGAWAGPVVAAAVILPPTVYRDRRLLWGVTDSKRLSAPQRRHWLREIERLAVAIGVSFVAPRTIDARGIAAASRLAMVRALERLPIAPEQVIVDAFPLPPNCGYADRQHALIKADATCLAVASASICAKVARDALMHRLDGAYPNFAFGRHKGYGTPGHREALRRFGPLPVHRRSFRPVAERFIHVQAALAG